MGHESSQATFSWSQGIGRLLLLGGLVLVVASFMPLEWTKRGQWTGEDAAAYNRLSLEYHESAYQTAARSGRTEEEMAKYREELKGKFENKRDQLLLAQEQPQRWSRFLLWSGCVLSAAGYLVSLRRQG